MDLIYDGALSETMASTVKSMLEIYPYVLEISSHALSWGGFHQWQEDECPKYPVCRENWDGPYVDGYRNAYGLVHKDFDGDKDKAFLFFKSQQEKDRFIELFSSSVIAAEPFKTKL